VVNILFERAKKFFSTAQDLKSEMKYVKQTHVELLPQMDASKQKETHNGFSELISEGIYRAQLTWASL